jgi:hypothetical protein
MRRQRARRQNQQQVSTRILLYDNGLHIPF